MLRCLPFSTFHFLRNANSRFTRLETFFAQNRATDFRLKRHLVVLAAMVADDFKTLRSIFARRRFFRAAFGTSLRRHHITFIKCLLFLLRENKNFFALHTRNFYIRHRLSPFAKLTRFLQSVSQKSSIQDLRFKI